jgi:hypothetical protein
MSAGATLYFLPAVRNCGGCVTLDSAVFQLNPADCIGD